MLGGGVERDRLCLSYFEFHCSSGFISHYCCIIISDVVPHRMKQKEEWRSSLFLWFAVFRTW
jgi:hypothetical protein